MATHIVNPGSLLVFLVQRAAIHLRDGATLGDVAAAFAREGVTAVLVGPGANSIITERDLASGLAAGLGPDDAIDVLVTRHVVVVGSTTSVVDGAAMMLNQEIRHLVIDTGGNTFAMVTLREVMAALLQAVEPRIWLSSLRLAILDAP
jgi:signal-transduction protein with cAMP-binding, CBS, and nucleotidyltransferase domain